jgi:hypothetical protein
MKKVKVTLCLNYFDRSKRIDREIDHSSGLTVFQIVSQFFHAKLPCLPSVNGKLIKDIDYELLPGDHLVLIPGVYDADRLLNPFSSGHDPWEAIKNSIAAANNGGSVLDQALDAARTHINALPGVGALALWHEDAAKRNPWMVTVASTFAGLWTYGVGSYLVKYIAQRYGITPTAEAPNVPSPTTPHVPTQGFGGGGGGGGGGGFETSNSYSWSPQTMQQLGACLPRIYGEVKVQGNIIAGHVNTIEAGSHPGDQVLNCLIAIGQGPMKAFNQIEINNRLATTYENVEVNGRFGGIYQTAIPLFNDTFSPDSTPNLKLETGVWKQATTNGNEFDGLELLFTFPAGLFYVSSASSELHYQDVQFPITDDTGKVIGQYTGQKYIGMSVSGGDTIAYTVQFAIKYKLHTSSTWIDYKPNTFPDGVISVTETKTSSFTKTYRIDNLPHGQYDVIVYRITADQTGGQYGDELYFTGINSIIYDDFSYPRTGLVSIRALASSQLSGSFNFSTVVQGAYVRVWDGATWTNEYSTNPAWIAYDILTLPVLDDNGITLVTRSHVPYVAEPNVHRFDGEDPIRIDLASFKAWADYCDETTFTDSNGVTKPILGPNGVAEKRFTFNGIFDANRSQWDCLMEVCKMSRAMIVIKGYKYYAVIDKPGTPVQMFTAGNIILDSFEETFLSINDRATEFEVEYLNALNDYKREVVTIINPDAQITKQSSNEQYIGTTSITQAWRTAQFKLNCNSVICRFIKFDAEIDAITCTIGDLIYFAHELPQWGYSGRIGSVNISGPNAIGVTLDRSNLPYVNGVPYRMRIRQDDDTIIYRDSVGTGTVTNYFPFSPTVGSGLVHQYDVYSMGEVYFETKPFRVTKITPNTDLTFTIEAIEYNATVYDSDVGEPAEPTPDYSSLEKLPPVTDLALNEIVLKLQDGTLSDNIDVQFVKPLNFNMVAAEIWYKAPSSRGYTFAGRTYSDQFRISNLPMSGGSEIYTVAVSTVNSLGQKLDLNLAPSQTVQLLGMADPPSAVTSFYARQVGQEIRLDWKHIEDADLAGYEIRMGNAWDTGLVIGSKITDDYFYYRVELSGTYQFFIKAIDTTNHYSTTPTSVIVNAVDITPTLNIVYDHNWVETPASGTLFNFTYATGYGLCGGFGFQFAMSAGTGSYETAEIDLLKSGNKTVRFIDDIDSSEDATDLTFPDRTDLTFPDDTDLHISGEYYKYPVFMVTAATGATKWWGVEWNPYYGPVDVNGRYFKFREDFIIPSSTARMSMCEFRTIIDVPETAYKLTALSISASGTTISFATYGLEFYATPGISATPLNSTLPLVPYIYNKTATGFTIKLLDIVGDGVAGTADINIFGY